MGDPPLASGWEYIEEFDELLQKVRLVSRPDGAFYIEVWIRIAPRVRFMLGTFHTHDKRDCHRLGPRLTEMFPDVLWDTPMLAKDREVDSQPDSEPDAEFLTS